MARVNPDDLPAVMVVLGLVIEQPDQTVKHIGQCIDKRFSNAHFSRATAQTTLERYAKSGWVSRSHEGRRRSEDRYRILKPGARAFRDWMYDIPQDGPEPALREAMCGRIELCQLEDLPRLRQQAEEEVDACQLLYERATMRLNRHERSAIGRTAYLERARAILLHVDPMHWAARRKRYQQIADALSEIIDDMGGDGVLAVDGV
jgi:DNA-binding PadR family transcriptional regulator